jgi:hypothetical protein
MFKVPVLLLICWSFAFAQLDSLALRAKLGSPLHREIFHVDAGFDVTVDYAAGGRVCRLEVPALMPVEDDAKVSNSDVMRQKMYDFLAEIVPVTMRGLKTGQMSQVNGLVSMISTEYENVWIHELRAGIDPFAKDNTIMVAFKNESCDPADAVSRQR